MRLLFVLLISIFLFSCSNKKLTSPEHLIADANLRVAFEKYLDRSNYPNSREGRFLKALLRDDSTFIRRELKELNSYYQRNDTLMTDSLKRYLTSFPIDSISKPGINAFRFEKSRSLIQSNTIILLTQNTVSNQYQLKLIECAWHRNHLGKLEIRQKPFEKTIQLQEMDWNHFIKLLDQSYFWRIMDGDGYNSYVDGSTSSIEGILHQNGRIRHHRVTINNAEGSFEEACSYLMKLAYETKS